MAWCFRFLDFVRLRLHDVVLLFWRPFRSFLTRIFCKIGAVNKAASPFLVFCWWYLPVMSATTLATTWQRGGCRNRARKQISLDLPPTLVVSDFCVPSTGLHSYNFSICFSFCLPCEKKNDTPFRINWQQDRSTLYMERMIWGESTPSFVKHVCKGKCTAIFCL